MKWIKTITCCVADCIYGKKRMWLQVCKETKRRRLTFYQHHQRPDCQSNLTCNQVYVLAWHNLWWIFFGKNFINNRYPIKRLLRKRSITLFKREIWAAKVYTLVKISWLTLSVSGCSWKNFQRSVQAHFLTSQLGHSILGIRFGSSISLLAG